MSIAQDEVANQDPRSQRQRRMRRVQAGMAVFVICLGLTNLFGVLGKSRALSYHTLDVMRLVIAGAGFGVGLVLLVQFFTLSNQRSEARKEI